MNALPIEAPPDGDVILSTRFIIGIAIITILAALTVCLRMYVRAVLSRSIGWDDWIMVAASLIMVVTNAFLIVAYHHGLGRHIYYLQEIEIPIIFMWLWAAEPTNLFAVYLVRVSIALFLLRLVPPKRKYTWVIWTTIALLTISDIYVFFVFFLQCRPIKKVWHITAPGTCVSEHILASAIWLYQAVSIPADIAFIAIPICLFWGLKVAVRTRIALIVICSLGVLTSICAIVKTALLPRLLDKDPDKTACGRTLLLGSYGALRRYHLWFDACPQTASHLDTKV